jgi:hypothetical protein
VAALREKDSRVRLEEAPPLPGGWNGKQHACARLAEAARHDVVLFIDADVRLSPDAARDVVSYLERTGADLVSGFPRQETGSFLEHLLVPMMHVVLLCFLPLWGMRRFRHPAFSAGCGQFMCVRRESYRRAGGHAAIRQSRHDGVKLPALFRKAGLRTDLVDVTRLASCRMYHDARETWSGLAKNATEGMGHPAAIGPFTVLLLGGQVLPFVLTVCLVAWPGAPASYLAASVAAVAMVWGMRCVCAVRFAHPWTGIVLHPVGVSLLVAVQWYALGLKAVGRGVAWKGRN